MAPMLETTVREDSDVTRHLLPSAEGSDAMSDVHDEVEIDPWAPYYAEKEILNTDPKIGLTRDEAKRRMDIFKPNSFPEKRPNQLLELIKTFFEPMAIIVWMAILIEVVQTADKWPGSDARSDLIDVFVLLLLQFLNGFVGWYENLMAEEKIRELAEGMRSTAMVIRDSITTEMAESELVPGDIIVLRNGSRIPADCKLIDDNGVPIKVDESMLTGESEPQKRHADEHSPLAGSSHDRCISQTVLSSGKANAIVLRTGIQTNYYKIYSLMTAQNDVSHFETVLQQLLIALVCVGVVVVIVVFTYLMAGPPKESLGDTLGFCVVLLIASIPIAMKVVCTTTLAMGAGELAKEQAIVQRLSSIEELAGLTILCSDKTGTLTLNKMDLKNDLDTNNMAEKAILDAMEEDHPGKQGFHRIFTDVRDERNLPFDRHTCLKMAVLATEWTVDGEDAIDRMLLGASVDTTELSKNYRVLRHLAFDPGTKLTHSQLEYVGPNGDQSVKFRVAKGAVQQILDICANNQGLQYKGKHIAYSEMEAMVLGVVDDFALRGIRCIVIARSDHQGALGATPKEEKARSAVAGNCPDWYPVGILTFLDPARPDSAHVISKAQEFGVMVKMITGDSQPIAKEMCNTVGLGDNILNGTQLVSYSSDKLQDPVLTESKFFAKKHGDLCLEADGFAQVKPEHKYLIVESLREMGYLVGMCGDGVNDAPALKRADVGIAVQGATSAAQASSDIVLTQPGLSTIVTAMIVSRKIFTRMQNFVIYRVACTEQLLFFFLISCLCFKPSEHMPHDWVAQGRDPDDWPDYFALPVLALVTITILNDGTIISVAYDNVEASKLPQSWNLPILYWISSVIGLIALISSIVLLQLGLDSSKGGNNGLCAFGIDALNYGEIQTMMYLKISLSDYGSIFNARTKSWCWSRAPSIIVVGAALFAVTLATIFSFAWPFGAGMKSIKWNVILFVWVYVIIWSLIQDAAKVLNYNLLFKLGLVEEVGVINEDDERIDAQMIGNPIKVDQEDNLSAGFVAKNKDRACWSTSCDSLRSSKSTKADNSEPTSSFEADEPRTHLLG